MYRGKPGPEGREAWKGLERRPDATRHPPSGGGGAWGVGRSPILSPCRARDMRSLSKSILRVPCLVGARWPDAGRAFMT